MNLLLLLLLAFPFLAHAQPPIPVAAGIQPVADFARQVGGERVNVTRLLPPGANPHSFDPSPSLVASLSNARVFFRVGAGLEYWADRIVSSSASSVKTVTLIDGLDVLPFGEEDPQAHGDHGHDDDGHEHGTIDPHVWLDPLLAMRMVDRMASELSSLDPSGAGFYNKRAELYKAELKKLHDDIVASVSRFRTKEFVTFHNSWNYFARRYGLKLAGIIEEAPGREAGPRKLAALVRRIKSSGIKVIFAETQFSPRAAEAIARESGARVAMLDPMGGGPGYISMMRANLAAMEKAMK
ncbi:MAG: zinc ABC transporter substrate-binding protein [Nitrospirae bacterium]|nr:zinc ABC transporter substrate-binding protein [Nitrospirota bacterium]